MKLSIMDNCTGCGACESINSDVFEVIDDTMAIVHQEFVDGNEQDCIDAAIECPVNAIMLEDF